MPQCNVNAMMVVSFSQPLQHCIAPAKAVNQRAADWSRLQIDNRPQSQGMPDATKPNTLCNLQHVPNNLQQH